VPNVLVVNPGFPARNLDEFLEVVKAARPGAYQFASAGNGSLNHLLGEMLNSIAGVEIQHIPYKGIAPALTDVIGGQVPMAFASLPSVLGQLKSGRLLALGVSSPQRSPMLPGVPAIGEKLPGYSGMLWVGLFAPRGVAVEVERKLQDAMARVLVDGQTRTALSAQGVELAADTTPRQLAAVLQEDVSRWARIVKLYGARID
jgi:tripartite-type tricarboxylate transporter receptor subunit TctC